MDKINALDQLDDRHRPDSDTGLDGEWSREYHLYLDTDTKEEKNDTVRSLGHSNDKPTADDIKWFEETAQVVGRAAPSSSSGGADGPGGSGGNELVEVKTEPVDEKKEKKQKEIEDLAAKLQTDPKKPMRNIGDAIAELKAIYHLSKDGKYLQEFHADVKAYKLQVLLFVFTIPIL